MPAMSKSRTGSIRLKRLPAMRILPTKGNSSNASEMPASREASLPPVFGEFCAEAFVCMVKVTVAAPALAAMVADGEKLPVYPVGKLRKTGKRFSRMLPILLLLIASMAAVVGLNGCGGKSGPPPQSYTVGVTATSGTLSHTSNITLTVE